MILISSPSLSFLMSSIAFSAKISENIENSISPSLERVRKSSAPLGVTEIVFLIDWWRFQIDWISFEAPRSNFRSILGEGPGRAPTLKSLAGVGWRRVYHLFLVVSPSSGGVWRQEAAKMKVYCVYLKLSSFPVSFCSLAVVKSHGQKTGDTFSCDIRESLTT